MGESKDNYDVRRKLMDEMQSHIEECLSEYHNIRFVLYGIVVLINQ